MNDESKNTDSPRVREGEKFIAEPSEGPYQFDESSSSQDVIALPNGEVVVRTNLDELIDAMAAKVFTDATMSVTQFGVFHLALSSAPILYPLYERLMYDPNVRALPWQSTEVWLVDQEDEFPNIVQETIIEHADIPKQQVHCHLPNKMNEEEPLKVDCLIVSDEVVIPEEVNIHQVIVFATSVKDCEVFAKTCNNTKVNGFVLQENH